MKKTIDMKIVQGHAGVLALEASMRLIFSIIICLLFLIATKLISIPKESVNWLVFSPLFLMFFSYVWGRNNEDFQIKFMVNQRKEALDFSKSLKKSSEKFEDRILKETEQLSKKFNSLSKNYLYHINTNKQFVIGMIIEHVDYLCKKTALSNEVIKKTKDFAIEFKKSMSVDFEDVAKLRIHAQTQIDTLFCQIKTHMIEVVEDNVSKTETLGSDHEDYAKEVDNFFYRNYGQLYKAVN